MTGTISISL